MKQYRRPANPLNSDGSRRPQQIYGLPGQELAIAYGPGGTVPMPDFDAWDEAVLIGR